MKQHTEDVQNNIAGQHDLDPGTGTGRGGTRRQNKSKSKWNRGK